jgi:GR25 family glycosyltransferase involved in LPS biosynthesis
MLNHIYCLTLPEKPHREAAARVHFVDNGLDDVTFVPGVNGEKFGLKTIFPYAVDDPSGNFFCGHHETGIFLSHYMLWIHVMLSGHTALIMEDDCKWLPGWRMELERALNDVPEDFDFLFVGSCACAGLPKRKIKGRIHIAKYPACFHAYIITPVGARIMVEDMRKMFGPVDLMTFVKDPRGGSIPPFDRMKVYTILPRLAEQFNTNIPE